MHNAVHLCSLLFIKQEKITQLCWRKSKRNCKVACSSVWDAVVMHLLLFKLVYCCSKPHVKPSKHGHFNLWNIQWVDHPMLCYNDPKQRWNARITFWCNFSRNCVLFTFLTVLFTKDNHNHRQNWCRQQPMSCAFRKILLQPHRYSQWKDVLR